MSNVEFPPLVGLCAKVKLFSCGLMGTKTYVFAESPSRLELRCGEYTALHCVYDLFKREYKDGRCHVLVLHIFLF